jgi:hypothetical protein
MEDRFIRISEAEAAFDATTEQVAAGLVEYLKDKFMYWTPGAPPPEMEGKAILIQGKPPEFDCIVCNSFVRREMQLDNIARWMEIKA